MTGKDAIKRLEQEGWRLSRIKGSHHIMVKGGLENTIPVHGNKDLKKGLFYKIAKKAGWL